MARKYALFLVLALLVSLGWGSQAQDEQELFLEQGLNDYEGVQDTTIYSENDNSNGGGGHVFVGLTRRVGDERRALIRFDLSEIPTDVTITFARLELSVSRVPSAAQTSNISVHRLSADWGEGEADAFGQEGRGEVSADGDATWVDNFKGDSTWTAQGGDFDPQPSGLALAGAVGTRPAWEGEGLIADVQDWVDGTEDNFGWILVTREEAKRFHSSNGEAGESLKPRLTIRFTIP